MPPVRDTMCLVHSNKRKFRLLQKIKMLWFGKRLRRHIQQLGSTREYTLLNFVDDLFRKCRVEKGSLNTHGVELVYLILH